MEGVVAAEVSYDDKRATVRYAPDQVTTQQMIEAVDATGFRATLRDPQTANDEPHRGQEPTLQDSSP